MATIINNPNNDDRERRDTRETHEYHEYREDGTGTGIVLGIVIAVLLIVGFVYLLPTLRGGGGTQTPGTPNTGGVLPPTPSSSTNNSSTINVNLNGGSSPGTSTTQ